MAGQLSGTIYDSRRGPGVPGSNPALGKEWSRDYPIDVPATPQLRSSQQNFATITDDVCPFTPVESFLVATRDLRIRERPTRRP